MYLIIFDNNNVKYICIYKNINNYIIFICRLFVECHIDDDTVYNADFFCSNSVVSDFGSFFFLQTQECTYPLVIYKKVSKHILKHLLPKPTNLNLLFREEKKKSYLLANRNRVFA